MERIYIETRSGGACLVDLTKTPPAEPKVIPTQLNDEAYPIEPDWDFIASPNHEDGKKMHYYRLKDLLSVPKDQQKPVYTSDFNEYYHSAATMAPGQARVMVWSDLQYQDYAVTNGDNATHMTPLGSPKFACHNLLPHNFDSVKISTLRHSLEDQFALCSSQNVPIMADREACENKIVNSADYKDYSSLKAQLNLVLENPILSKNGSEIAGLQNGQITLFTLQKNGQCQLSDQLPFRGSKVNFSYPEKGKKGKISFLGDNPEMGQFYNNIYIYDRDIKKTFLLPSENISTSGSYPGFTVDGRLIYLTTDPSTGTSTVTSADLRNFDPSKCEELRQAPNSPSIAK